MVAHPHDDPKALTAVLGAALLVVLTLLLVALAGNFGHTRTINSELQPAHMSGLGGSSL